LTPQAHGVAAFASSALMRAAKLVPVSSRRLSRLDVAALT
jgi:hypothetical protein